MLGKKPGLPSLDNAPNNGSNAGQKAQHKAAEGNAQRPIHISLAGLNGR